MSEERYINDAFLVGMNTPSSGRYNSVVELSWIHTSNQNKTPTASERGFFRQLS